jgi:RNA polymerase sigma-70 factor (ECF subfamily)
VEAVSRLVCRAQKRDLVAFEQLVLLYQDRVYALARHLAGNPLDAEDLAQEVFVSAYRGIHAFRGESDFGTWLHRIAVNLWLNSRRKAAVAVVSLDEPVTTKDGTLQREVPTLEGEPESLLMGRELNELLQRALEGLPKEQRVVVVLRELEDYTYEEMARILNCSLGTVRSRLSRAREALRKAVSKRAGELGVRLVSKEETCAAEGTKGLPGRF